MAIITAPVGLYDVMVALGESKEDIGTLCTSDKINKWAKFKPYRINQPFDITDTQRKAINFGLTFPAVYVAKATLIAGLKGNTKWGYDRPTEIDWQRITDFAGYDHDAKPPFATIPDQSVLLSSGPTINTQIPISGTGHISLGEFEKPGLELSQWYFSILLYNETKSYIASAAVPFSQGNAWVVSFEGAIGLAKGLYNAIPFACSKRWIPGPSDPTGFKAVGIGAKPVPVRLITEQDGYTIHITAVYNEAYTRVSYTASIHNGWMDDKEFANVTMWAAKDANGTDSKIITQFGNVTVRHLKKWTKEGTLAIGSILTREYSYLGLKYDGLSEITWFGIQEPIIGGGGGGDVFPSLQI